jgi:hypothetical protein
MSRKNKFSRSYINECFLYEDGKLFWKKRPLHHFKNESGMKMFNSSWPGKEAGTFRIDSKDGSLRRSIKIEGIAIDRPLLVWILLKGFWTTRKIDHRDHDTTNDRIENLRLCSSKQNLANSRLRKGNKCGFKGVCFRKDIGKFQSHIRIDKVQTHLGYFATAEEAHAAYVAKAKEVFGEFACAG